MKDCEINLTDFEKIPILPEKALKEFGKTLIIAPHPDDESLGCGGAILLLRKNGLQVSILVLSDGTLSHPNSQKFPAEKLCSLREDEILKAAKILGVLPENVTFFRYKDREVPDQNSTGYSNAVGRLREFLERKKPETIFVPWRRDPHPDHRAAFQLIDAAKSENQKIIEYPIWLYELAQSSDAPLTDEVSGFRLDVSSVVEKKRQAVFAHRSQTSDLIDDDADGFRLTPEILKEFFKSFEIYLTAK